ncbi:MAG: ABC transporter substrate-binding protein [Proteobacteria bacterium]|nr:ABC transporter substrate-binding protein [Pseudomonadota bacterium]
MSQPRATILALFLALALLTGACGKAEQGQAGATVPVTDATGRVINVRVSPKRVVTLNKNAAEILRMFGVTDRIVGVSDWIPKNPDYWPELVGARNVGKFNDPDVEAIAELKPDLVLCYQGSPGPGFEDKMAAAGIQVLRLELYRIGVLPRDVEALGRIFGREDKAREYLDWLKVRMDEIARRVAADPERPKVYLEAYAEFAACGSGSGMHERLVFAGGRNIGEVMQPNASPVSPEWVLEQQPWAVVKMCSQNGSYSLDGPGGMVAQREALLARTGWNKTPAGKAGRVYLMTTDVTSGGASVVGIAHIAKWLHPKTCADLDPMAWHREYIERFQGRPWRGVYVHPAE